MFEVFYKVKVANVGMLYNLVKYSENIKIKTFIKNYVIHCLWMIYILNSDYNKKLEDYIIRDWVWVLIGRALSVQTSKISKAHWKFVDSVYFEGLL